MRGKAGTESSTPTSARITPAYAGKRNGQSPTMLLRRDHPRVCGEKNAILSGRKTEPGSPPRMRGKGRQLDVLVHGVRITPAYAGKRACTAVCSTNATGSPPRMRGKAVHCRCFQQPTGITPAYAGKSQTVSFGTTGRKDHPRVCGEKKMEPIIKVDNVWITPAYAGKRKARHGMGQGYRDHPRVCGEKNNGIIYHRRRIGSPPRMRGKVPDIPQEKPETGITPAYAGKSVLSFGACIV